MAGPLTDLPTVIKMDVRVAVNIGMVQQSSTQLSTRSVQRSGLQLSPIPARNKMINPVEGLTGRSGIDYRNGCMTLRLLLISTSALGR